VVVLRKVLKVLSLLTSGLYLAGVAASVPSQAAEGKVKKETKAAVGALGRGATKVGRGVKKETKAVAGAVKKAATWTGKEAKAGASAVKKAVTRKPAKPKKVTPKPKAGAGKTTVKPQGAKK